MTLALESDGFTFGRLDVPPFRCHVGECLCLHVPPVGTQDVYDLPRVLSGDVALPGIRLLVPARYAERPIPRRNFLGFLRNPRVFRWLERDMKVPAPEAQELCARLAVNPNWKIGVIGWTERSLLNLEAALRGPPQLVVFDTWGLAPCGVGALCETAVARRDGRAVVAVTSYPSAEGACFRDGRCVELGVAKESIRNEAA